MVDVIPLSEFRRSNPKRQGELRRLALQLAIQLPADPSEALAVTEYLRELVAGYLFSADG